MERNTDTPAGLRCGGVVVPADAQETEQRATDARLRADATELMATYCLDCHDSSSEEGGLDLSGLLEKDGFDGSLMFENLITGKMPPDGQGATLAEEKRLILNWLAKRRSKARRIRIRRISRHEFVHSVNDLLGTKLDLAERDSGGSRHQ